MVVAVIALVVVVMAVLTAQVAVLAVERERLAASISLYRAVGGGWDSTQSQKVTNAQTQISENK